MRMAKKLPKSTSSVTRKSGAQVKSMTTTMPTKSSEEEMTETMLCSSICWT